MNPLHFDLEKIRREEMLQQAAQDRLARLALEKADHPVLLGPVMVKVGDWLVIVGTRLQTQYGAMLTVHEMPISTKTVETGA